MNELEDKLKEASVETTTKDVEYQERIRWLTENNTDLTRENSAYKLKLETMQKELEDLRSKPQHVEFAQVASPAPTVDAPCADDCSCQDIVDKVLCERRNPTVAAPVPAPAALLPKRNRRATDITDLIGCGSCSKDGDCSCYDASVAAVSVPKRSISPLTNTPKRSRTIDHLDELETDFTTTYMARSSPGITHMPDPCGFCSDGSPCVCAEMGNAMDMEDTDTDGDIKLAPLLGGPGLLAPPGSSAGEHVSLRRMAGLDKPVPLHPPSTRPTPNPSVAAPIATTASSSGCKPGGCDQCKSDPMSTLFCQSVSTRVSSSSGGCCGGTSPGGGCCKDIETAIAAPLSKRTTRASAASVVKTKFPPPTQTGTYIPCSAAYQTLSRHRAFDEATADLGALVRPLVIQSVDGRCPQVEVSSVRDVLKMLDRRFGRD